MTGFGRTELQTSLGTITIEARSENHRYLDITYQVPDLLTKIENNIAEIVKKHISRGKFRIYISAQLINKSSHLDGNLAKNYLMMLQKLKKDLQRIVHSLESIRKSVLNLDEYNKSLIDELKKKMKKNLRNT